MAYEIFEHAVDAGLRVRARDLNGLFRDAAAGLFDLVTDYAALQKTPEEVLRTVEMNFREENAPELFMHWLQELLFFFSARKLIPVRFDFITLTPLMLKMKGKAALFDPRRHVSRHEVKAVTHHRFRVFQTPGGWEAEVILDI